MLATRVGAVPPIPHAVDAKARSRSARRNAGLARLTAIGKRDVGRAICFDFGRTCVVALGLFNTEQKAVVAPIIMCHAGRARRTVAGILTPLQAAIAALERQALKSSIADEAIAVGATGGAHSMTLRGRKPHPVIITAAPGYAEPNGD